MQLSRKLLTTLIVTLHLVAIISNVYAAPQNTQTIPNYTWDANTSLDNILDLNDYFTSPEGLELTYTANNNTNIGIEITSSSSPTDIDQYVKLLLQDEIPSTLTAHGNAQIDTTQAKFGTSSILLDGDGDYLTSPDSADWSFGSEDFTIDFWVKFNTVDNEMVFAGQFVDNDNYWEITKNSVGNSHKLFMAFASGGLKAYYYMAGGWNPYPGQWYHLAFVREGASAKIFIDGVSQALAVLNATTKFENKDLGDINSPLKISRRGNSSQYINGRIDELRISKGIARWSANFTPNDHPYGYKEDLVTFTPATDFSGQETITFTATDTQNNSVTSNPVILEVVAPDTTPPEIIITSPAEGAIFETGEINFTGTVDGEAFSEVITLSPGENTITKTATDQAGNTATASVTVYFDAQGLIGPEGGQVQSLDGKITLTIPEGALDSYAAISVDPVNTETLEDAAPEDQALLKAIDCQPDGTEFNIPAILHFALDEARIPGTPVELGLYDEAQDTIVNTGHLSFVGADSYSVTFFITHFSTYAALNSYLSSGGPIGAGVEVPLPDMLTGAFSHAVSLTIPPGRKKMDPNLALVYRSSNPNSWCGVGFEINPSYIIRSTKLGPPTYIDEQDTFLYITDSGTTELIHLIDNLYQAKIENSFTKFYKEADNSWRVLAKDGSTILFGQTPESKEISNLGTYSWYVTRAKDTNSNYIDYLYNKDQGKVYLSRIDYTGSEIGLSPTNSIEFFLEGRDDTFTSYQSSSKIITAKRLSEIQIKVNSELVWRYEFNYIYGQDTGRSLLESITQHSADGESFPAQVFKYQTARD